MCEKEIKLNFDSTSNVNISEHYFLENWEKLRKPKKGNRPSPSFRQKMNSIEVNTNRRARLGVIATECNFTLVSKKKDKKNQLQTGKKL